MSPNIELGELPDALSQAEAAWMLQCLTHAAALQRMYILVLKDPKAANSWGRACTQIEKGIHRAYPENEARYLIGVAMAKAKEGVAAQVAMMGAK